MITLRHQPVDQCPKSSLIDLFFLSPHNESRGTFSLLNHLLFSLSPHNPMCYTLDKFDLIVIYIVALSHSYGQISF